MKISSLPMNLRGWIKVAAVCLCAGTFEAPSLQAGEAPAPSPVPAEEEPFRNWITLGLGGVFTSGDDAQFEQRHGIAADFFGGIEDLHYEQDIGKHATLTVDGHAVFRNGDYEGRVELSAPEIGYIRAGYTQFRTWYDGNGGFFPGDDLFFNLYDNNFAIDRGDAWIELGLRLPDLPQITFRYDHIFRNGQKDSTEWGDTNLTGLTTNGTRNIVPTFLDIDESRDIFTLDVTQTVGNTDVGLGLRYELDDLGNSRNIRRRPFESSDRFLTQNENVQSDLFNAHVFSETRFDEGLLLSVAYSFTTMDTNTSGSRIYGPSYNSVFDPLFANRQFRDEGFLNLFGGSNLNQHVAALNLSWTPVKNLVIVPSIRFENYDESSASDYIETNVGSDLTTALDPISGHSDRDFWNVTESVDIRYTGVRDWSFYATGEWLQQNGNLNETLAETETGAIDIIRSTDDTVWTQKYKIGALWYPTPRLNIGTQYYYKENNYDYDHPIDSTSNLPDSGDRYPAFIRNQDFQTNDFNIRVTWHACSTMTFVGRYDFQRSTIDNQGDFLSEVQSAEVTTHILSGTGTWTPLARLYLQGTIHYVMSTTDTPADQQLPGVILDFDNDYWNGTVSVGFLIDDKTNLQADYFYYRADNFTDNSAFGQPYGAGAREHAATLTLSRQFTRALRGSLKYGYYSNRDETSGGHNNYQAHLLAASLQFRF